MSGKAQKRAERGAATIEVRDVFPRGRRLCCGPVGMLRCLQEPLRTEGHRGPVLRSLAGLEDDRPVESGCALGVPVPNDFLARNLESLLRFPTISRWVHFFFTE